MDAAQLIALYKIGNIESHEEGLRRVYQAGVLDGSQPIEQAPQVAPEHVAEVVEPEPAAPVPEAPVTDSIPVSVQ